MRETRAIRWSWIHILTVLLVVTGARPANAQGFISPFLGYNFGGDGGCPRSPTARISTPITVWRSGRWAASLVSRPNLPTPTTSSAPRRTRQRMCSRSWRISCSRRNSAPFNLYGLGGAGLIRTSIESAAQNGDENQISRSWRRTDRVLLVARRRARRHSIFPFVPGSRSSKLPNLPASASETKLDLVASRWPSSSSLNGTASPIARRSSIHVTAGDAMNVDSYRQRLLKLEQELVQRLGKEIETARDARDDQPDTGDLAHVDKLKGRTSRWRRPIRRSSPRCAPR